MSPFLGPQQLPESNTSLKQSQEQPRNLGHRGVGTVHDTFHHGYHSARLPSTHQQGNLSDTNAGSNCVLLQCSVPPHLTYYGASIIFMYIPCIFIVCCLFANKCTYIPYILEPNPHPFYSFRGLKISDAG